MRAFIRFLRSSAVWWNTRMTASVTLRYSSTGTKSYSVGAILGMIDVPPPVSSWKPRLPSTIFGMKPMSWMAVMAQSRSQPEKAVLNFRGSACVYGWRTKYRA